MSENLLATTAKGGMNLLVVGFSLSDTSGERDDLNNAKEGTHIAIKYRKTSSEDDEFEDIFFLLFARCCNVQRRDAIRGFAFRREVERGTSYFLFLSSNAFMFRRPNSKLQR